MHRQVFLMSCCFAVIVSLTGAWPISANPPWQLISFRRVEADPDKRYELEENSGPWLIFAASFAGDGAEREARELVQELRKKYKLPAYIHSKSFDFSGTIDGIGINPDRSPKRMKYDKSGVFDELAVLIGDYESVDDPALQKTLKKVKFAQPECLVKNAQSTTRRFAGLRAFHKKISGDEEKQRKGPMGNAFAVPNPLLPREFFAPKGIDSLVLKMNKDVKYSLLDCPAPFTVRVATFRGNSVIDQKKVSDIQNGNARMKSRLEQAAIDANQLTAILRQKGIKAYEFHDIHESYVTVGEFQWVGRPLADGKQEMNPDVLKVIQSYSPVHRPVTGKSGQALSALQPRTIKGIPFDVQPWPVEVPQRSIATDYVRQ